MIVVFFNHLILRRKISVVFNQLSFAYKEKFEI